MEQNENINTTKEKKKKKAGNVAQHFIRECLRVDGNAGCAVFFDDAQFFFVGRTIVRRSNNNVILKTFI